jgi:hypothetical protein
MKSRYRYVLKGHFWTFKIIFLGGNRSDPKSDPELFESRSRIRSRNSLKSRIRIRNKKFRIHNTACNITYTTGTGKEK